MNKMTNFGEGLRKTNQSDKMTICMHSLLSITCSWFTFHFTILADLDSYIISKSWALILTRTK
jgi:hypothetical protein